MTSLQNESDDEEPWRYFKDRHSLTNFELTVCELNNTYII